MIEAVIFDLDGVLLDSEQLWDQARRETVSENEGEWPSGATEAVQGMSSTEWSTYLKERTGLTITTERIVGSVLQKLLGYYRAELPLPRGAVEAVGRMADHWAVGLASSSNREVIDAILQLAGLADAFAATVSSEEVARGKPAPDVYLETARRLGVPASRCAAVEDSANGIRSASLCVLAVPNPHYPPGPGEISLVDLVLADLGELTVDAVTAADRNRRLRIENRIDEQEIESFPASDSHADWAGPGKSVS